MLDARSGDQPGRPFGRETRDLGETIFRFRGWTWFTFYRCPSFFPSSYGSHLTIIWKVPHVASV